MPKKLRVALGVMLILVMVRTIGIRDVKLESGTKIKISGRVTSDPTLYYAGEKFRVGKFEIIGFEDGVGLGDKVEIVGTVKQGNRVNANKVIVLETADKGAVTFIKNLQSEAKRTINAYLPEPEAGLLAGILLGAKQEVDYDFAQALRRTGTTHMVVASGTNVTFVGGAVVGVLAFILGRKKAYLGAIGAVWLFALMAGMDAPVVRASIMGSVAYAGLLVGRSVDILRLLLVTGWLMIMVKPELTHDIGFQLSFAATTGIVLVSKVISRMSGPVEFALPIRHPRQFRLRALNGEPLPFATRHIYKFLKLLPSSITQTMAAILFTLPVIAIHFGVGGLSWSAPVVNVLVGWMVAPMMIMGTALLLTGWIPGVGQIVAGFTYAICFLFVFIVRIFAG